MTIHGKIIDFRCRPPISAYQTLFDIKFQRLSWENKFVCAPHAATSPSLYKVGEQEGIELLLEEMDEAGVDLILVPGRKIPKGNGIKITRDKGQDFNVTDETLVELNRAFNNRAPGISGLDLTLPVEEIVEGIKLSVEKFGMHGVVLEPGYFTAADGGPLQSDDKMLYPIYETLVKYDVFLMHQSGIYAGPDFGVNDWPPLDRMLQDFPDLKVVLAHGGYPRVLEALALAVKHPNLYLSPDIYCSFPGGKLYIEAISQLPDQFIYASAYPFGTLKESADVALAYPLSDLDMEKYMYKNAKKLLKIK